MEIDGNYLDNITNHFLSTSFCVLCTFVCFSNNPQIAQTWRSNLPRKMQQQQSRDPKVDWWSTHQVHPARALDWWALLVAANVIHIKQFTTFKVNLKKYLKIVFHQLIPKQFLICMLDFFFGGPIPKMGPSTISFQDPGTSGIFIVATKCISICHASLTHKGNFSIVAKRFFPAAGSQRP